MWFSDALLEEVTSALSPEEKQPVLWGFAGKELQSEGWQVLRQKWAWQIQKEKGAWRAIVKGERGGKQNSDHAGPRIWILCAMLWEVMGHGPVLSPRSPDDSHTSTPACSQHTDRAGTTERWLQGAQLFPPPIPLPHPDVESDFLGFNPCSPIH